MKNTAPVAGCRLDGEARHKFAEFAHRYGLTPAQSFHLQSQALSWADCVGLWCNGQPCAGPFGSLARGLARRGVITMQGAGWAWAPEALAELWVIAQAQAEAEGLCPVPDLADAAPAPAQPATEATSAPAPSIADAALEASAALNAEGDAATARALAGIGRIRAGLRALEALEAPRPVLPGEATPPPAPIAQDGPTPELPRLRADAAAGRPVSLAALARAMAEDLLTPSPSPVSLAALRPEA